MRLIISRPLILNLVSYRRKNLNEVVVKHDIKLIFIKTLIFYSKHFYTSMNSELLSYLFLLIVLGTHSEKLKIDLIFFCMMKNLLNS